MKKSILAIILVPVMILNLSACGDNTEDAATKSLYAQGLDVIQLMSEMTQTEEYVDILAGSSEEIKSIAHDINTGDYSNPKAVYAISITDDNLAAMAGLDSLDNASDGLKSFLTQRLLGSLMTRINSMSGMANLAAASAYTVGKTFVDENAAEDVIYLYTYENAVPVAVTFTIGEDHAVSASGVFVMYDGFTCGSADEIKSFFSYIFFGYIDVDVTEVLPEY